MIHIVIAIKDRALGAFSKPYFTPTIGLAVRSFADEVNNPGSEMHRHPEDYELYQLASYDDESGKFENLAIPVSLALAHQHKQPSTKTGNTTS